MEHTTRWHVIMAVILGLVLAGCGGTGGPGDDDGGDDDGGGGTIWNVTVREYSPVHDIEATWVYTLDRTPFLDWSDVPEAVPYELQIGTSYADLNVPDVTGTTPIIECSDSSYQVTDLLDWDTHWFWRIRASKADGTVSSWIMPFHFQVDKAVVVTPFPADGGSTDDPTPVLDWNDLPGAQSYDLQVAADAGGGVILFEKTGLPASEYELSGTGAEQLPIGITRYWFIRAKNDTTGGTDFDTYSEWSTSFDLTLVSTDIPVGNLRDGVITLDRTPLLSWNEISGATGYDIYLSTDPSTVWSGPSSFQAGMSSTTCTISPQEFGAHVAWGIKARVGADPGFWPTSAVMEFTVNSAYHPLGGPNGVSGSKPNLWWTPMIGAVEYDVEVALDDAFHSLVQSDTVTAALEPIDTAVTYGNSRFWRVRARSDMGDETAWSPAFCFTSAWSQQTINPTYPSAGATIFDQTPEFDWTDVNDRDSWEVWVTDVLPFESKFSGKYTTSSADSEFQLPSALVMGKTWYWRVRPLNPDGVTGLWSLPFAFTTSADFTPTPTSPAPSADQTPTVTWSSMPGAVSYWIQVATSEAGVASATMVDKGSATSHPFPTIPIGSSRYWRVLARNDNNTASPWSAISTVSVTWTYADPTPIFPIHKEADAPVKPTMTWAAIANAASYQVQLTAGTPPVEGSYKANCGATPSYTPLTNLAPGTYFWRVRAVNGEGFAGPWTSTWEFTVK